MGCIFEEEPLIGSYIRNLFTLVQFCNKFDQEHDYLFNKLQSTDELKLLFSEVTFRPKLLVAVRLSLGFMSCFVYFRL